MSWHALDPFLVTLRQEGREAFLGKHSDPILIFKLPEDTQDEDLTDTHTLSSSRVELAEKLTPAELQRLSRAEGYRVLRIRASGFDADGNTVSVGRSKISDLVVRHQTVSKEHASFRLMDDGRVVVRDLGSRNGTRLNGAKLQVDWEPTLESGDRITFGNVTLTYQTAEAFCDFLAVVLDEP